jgi:hypothetical protein
MLKPFNDVCELLSGLFSFRARIGRTGVVIHVLKDEEEEFLTAKRLTVPTSDKDEVDLLHIELPKAKSNCGVGGGERTKAMRYDEIVISCK